MWGGSIGTIKSQVLLGRVGEAAGGFCLRAVLVGVFLGGMAQHQISSRTGRTPRILWPQSPLSKGLVFQSIHSKHVTYNMFILLGLHLKLICQKQSPGWESPGLSYSSVSILPE